ncbi:MAG: VWA domain-containing protein [Acidobacteriaceae bacterium]|nr:VWA domain-containing protein [Acidobacteriaceae bacterium]
MKLIRSSRKKGERGATIILFTFLTVLLLIPVIGLAIDGAIVMWEKARLSSSVDAAAYAAGRSLSIGTDVNSARTAAAATATTYFNANFQPGSMGTTVPQFTPQVPPPAQGLWTITVDAQVDVPLYFLRILGFSQASLSAHSQVSRKNVNIIVVLDRSASLSLYDGGASCRAMIASAQNFTNMFVPGQDMLGLVTFQTTASVDFAPDLNFKTKATYMPGVNGMPQLIGQIQCVGYTNTVSALNLAYTQIQAINQPGALNIIVFFSDGRPDAITASFTAKSATDNRDVPNPNTPDQSSPPSTCTSGNAMTGVLVAFDEYPDRAASTLGILPTSTSPINSTLPSTGGNQPPYYGLFPYPINDSSTQGCTFSASNNQSVSFGNITRPSHNTLYCSGSSCDVRKDIYVIPNQDVNGNATNTNYRPLSQPDGLFSSCASQAGCIRPDTATGVVNASLNAAYEQVKAIRRDKTLNPIIYSIGLGQYIDTGFMQDVANDSAAPNHDPTSPTGQYVYAPTPSQLSSAFQQIASQVLRISQ